MIRVSFDASNGNRKMIDQRKTPYTVRTQVEAATSIPVMSYGMSVALPELDRGGWPNTTVETGSGLTVVRTSPLASVRTTVASVGIGATSGRVVTFNITVAPFTTSSISGV